MILLGSEAATPSENASTISCNFDREVEDGEVAVVTRQDKTRQLYFTRVAQSAARLVSLGALGSIKLTYTHIQ